MAQILKTLLLKFFPIALILAIAGDLAGQQIAPPKWTYTTAAKEVKTGETFELIFKADIPDGWYVYSNDMNPDLGPMLTEFSFKEQGKELNVSGTAKPFGNKKKYDEVWEGEVSIFVKKLEFRQKVKLNGPIATLHGTVDYQMCSDVTGQCVPFSHDFEIKAPAVIGGAPAKEAEPVALPDKAEASTEADSQQNAPLEQSTPQVTAAADDGTCKPKTFEGEEDESTKAFSYWGFMLLAFLSGLAALLTPCVFPMIPMTVTYFLKSNKTRAQAVKTGLLYGFFIIFIYTLIGTLVSLLFGAEIANWLSTHWVPNVFFFLIFLIFAASFFGMFELTLPSSFVNKIDRGSDKGGMAGVFFMAFTLVLVSFSCTGPIVGTILVESAQGGSFIKPLVGMFAFSMAFALPFGLFAIFPNLLQSLPKSGGWLNSVKVVLGFIELALALKFLSVADQTYHWGLLPREVYLSFWIIIFTLMGFYLLGKIKFAHDSDLQFLGVPRLLMAVATFAFVVYMIPGLFGAALPPLAGYLPPMSTQNFNLPGKIQEVSPVSSEVCEEPIYAEKLHLPHGLKGYFEYQQAIACARKQNKPLFIDFTGHGCVNCRKMEESVWAHPEVLKRLKEKFVVVALYVDDRTQLPENAWVTSKVDGKQKTTVGKVNADFQICNFNNNAQPYYCLLDGDENLLAAPKGTDYDVQSFINFLDKAYDRFQKRQKIAQN